MATEGIDGVGKKSVLFDTEVKLKSEDESVLV